MVKAVSAPTKIVEGSSGKDLVFNMETGETTEKAKPMDVIAEEE